MLQKRCVRDGKIVRFLHRIISRPSTIFRTYPGEMRCAVAITNFTGHGGAGRPTQTHTKRNRHCSHPLVPQSGAAIEVQRTQRTFVMGNVRAEHAQII